MKVFVVQHEHERDGSADVKLIGVYATRAEADQARERLSAAEGFRDHPDGFSIDAYELGRDHWTSGFATVPGDAEDVGHRPAAE